MSSQDRVDQIHAKYRNGRSVGLSIDLFNNVLQPHQALAPIDSKISTCLMHD